MAYPHKTQMYGQTLVAKKRKCNTCGRVAVRRTNSCQKWCKEQKKNVYCGTMRVIR